MVMVLANKVDNLQKQLNNLTTVEDSKKQSQYFNYNVSQLEMMVRDAHSLAISAYDKADEFSGRYDWIVGLTTEEIDSIRSLHE